LCALLSRDLQIEKYAVSAEDRPTPPQRPVMPQRPERPDPSPPQGSSVLSIIFMGSLALFVLVGLVLLTIVFNGAIFVLAGIFLFAAFHYLIWGWWLSKMIRREDEPGRHDESGDANGSPKQR